MQFGKLGAVTWSLTENYRIVYIRAFLKKHKIKQNNKKTRIIFLL